MTTTMDPLEIPIPQSLDSNNFRQAWTEWVEFRMSLKKVKRWDLMFSKQLVWLSSMPIPTAIAIIDQSIRQGWQGLFELKTPPRGSQSPNHGTPKPSLYTLQEQLKLIERQMKEIENGASCDAFGPAYTADEKARRRILISQKKELMAQLGIG